MGYGFKHIACKLRIEQSLWRKLITRKDLMFLFCIAITLRLVLFLLSLNQIGTEGLAKSCPDSILYLNMAKDLLAGTNNYEYGFFTFGPGFAYWLAFQMKLFGQGIIPIIIVQILISGASCLLIYKLAMMLTDSHPTAIISGYLAALSYTSISLSIPILSDSIYFFLFLWSLILFLSALKSASISLFTMAGIVLGIAILVRSIGQFWPLMMILISIPFIFGPRIGFDSNSAIRRKLYIGITISVGLSIILISGWIIRNRSIHGIPTLAMTSAGGVANVAAFTLEKIEKRPIDEIRKKWNEDYMKSKGLGTLTLADSFRLNLEKARETFSKYPFQIIKTYLLIVWENINSISYFHRVLIPKFDGKTIPMEGRINKWGLNKLEFWLSILGMVLLLVRRKYYAVLILGSILFYYSAMIGFTKWQGSRLFFPAQIAVVILIAIVIVNFYKAVARLARWLCPNKLPILTKEE